MKVTLEGVTPAIWRRFLVPGRISLAGLHLVLQTVKGRLPGGGAGVLAAIADPRNPALTERREWVGQAYDPERFDLRSVNARLRRFKLEVVSAAR